MGFGGGGSSSTAAAPAPVEPVGTPGVDAGHKEAGEQNRTEGSPLSRPLLTQEEAKPRNSLLG